MSLNRFKLSRRVASISRPNKRRALHTRKVRNALEEEARIIADADDSKRVRKIEEYNNQGRQIFNSLLNNTKLIDSDITKHLDLKKEVIALQLEQLKKEEEAKIIPEELRGEIKIPIDKRLAKREAEIKKAVLISHVKLQNIINRYFPKDSPLNEVLNSILDTRTTARQKKLYTIAYSLLSLNDFILKDSNQPPLDEDERYTRINDFGLLSWLLAVLITLAVAFISVSMYAHSKLEKAEKDLNKAEGEHNKLILKYRTAKIHKETILKDKNYLLGKKVMLLEKEDNLLKKLSEIETVLEKTSDHEEFLQHEKNLAALKSKLRYLDQSLENITNNLRINNLALETNLELLDSLEDQEMKLLEKVRKANEIIKNCRSYAFLAEPVKDRIKDFSGTFFCKPTKNIEIEEKRIIPKISNS